MEYHTVTRTGMRPLRFRGECLYEDTTRTEDGLASQRWWEVEIYKLEDGRYVVARNYRTGWLSEAEVNEADVVDSADQAIFALEEHDPLEPVVGFPPGERFEHRQRHLEHVLRMAWRALVSRAAAALGVAEEV